MSSVNIETIKSVLASSRQQSYQPSHNARHASVAAILRPVGDDIEALFILRSKKESDPWSGQMAFPGGHYETEDSCLRETAERETLEEIGVDLVKHAQYLGKIKDVEANPRGRSINMVVSPFVYLLKSPDVSVDMNYEVADVLWGSLKDMISGSSATSTNFTMMGTSERFPGYAVGGQVVWGLTLRMLDHFFLALDPSWKANY